MDYVGQHGTSIAPGDTSGIRIEIVAERSDARVRAENKANIPKRIASHEILNEIGRGGIGFRVGDPGGA